MKTVCYIDASNLMKNGYNVDHKKLFNYLKNRFNPEIVYFGAVFVGDYYYRHNFLKSDYLGLDDLEKFNEESLGDEGGKEKMKKQIRFIKKLNSFGFDTKVKPLKIMPGGKRKADCDVNITVEGMENWENYDRFILFSGDGDFLPFLRFLRKNKKEIEVFSFGQDGNKNSTAREIREFLGGNWHDLNEGSYRKILEFVK